MGKTSRKVLVIFYSLWKAEGIEHAQKANYGYVQTKIEVPEVKS